MPTAIRPIPDVNEWKAGESECCSQELAVLVEHGYSMTLLAWSRSVCGIVSPNASAVLRLMTSSNFVGRWTGRSPGFAPLRILSTYRGPSEQIAEVWPIRHEAATHDKFTLMVYGWQTARRREFYELGFGREEKR